MSLTQLNSVLKQIRPNQLHIDLNQIRLVLADSIANDTVCSNIETNCSDKLIDAAVLIALIERPNGLNVLLTKRAANLSHHAGQISFPGGRVDPDDSEPLMTALRESQEEIGLAPNLVEILGQCPNHKTSTGFNIYSFVGSVKQEFLPVLQQEEVEYMFEVPFAYLTDINNFRKETVVLEGSQRQFYSVNYKQYYIWGATAAILYGLGLRLANKNDPSGAD